MKRFESILATRFPQRAGIEEETYRENILSVSQWFDAHILVETADALGQVSGRSTGGKLEVKTLVVPFSTEMDFVERILELERRESASLLVLPLDQSIHLDEQMLSLSPAARLLLEESSIPILLIPERRLLDVPPFDSILIPVSGEKRRSPALEAGIELANSRYLCVDLVHVTRPTLRFMSPGSCLEAMTDSLPHEYANLIDAFIAGAAPYTSHEERHCIRDLLYRTGEVSGELARVMGEASRPLVIFDWKGRLSRGRAKILKDVLERATVPILLAREEPAHVSRLKVGGRFFATKKQGTET